MHNLNIEISADLAGWTIAFDLDGTLVDSAPDLVGALNTILVEDALPPVSLGEGRLLVGRGARWMVMQAFLAANVELPEERLDGLVERVVATYRDRIARETLPYDGCLAALDALAARGATLAVCTNKRNELSLALLDALNMTARFAAVIGADVAPAPKPDPRHLLMSIAEAGGDPARAVLVGDTRYDTEAAANANVPCIAVDFGYSQTPVAELGAAAVISHFDDLLAAITALPSCPAGARSL
ncbi:MAG: HAD hydrolase-like protein [Caulobacter sp.]|nr:HAD hydrolase-like protein [Caulobacter sp.]